MPVKAKPDYCFEVSWEVCNKVGGIYTVVKSKVGYMMGQYNEGYIAVGPYFQKKAFGEFDETVPPAELKKVFDTLNSEGIQCHYGTWLIEGNPHAILIDFTNFASKANDLKKELWDNYKIDSMGTKYYDYDEPIVFSCAVGRLLEEFAKQNKTKKVVGHFHEWMTGAALLFLKSRKSKVATCFTTHATMLGRTLSSHDMDLYSLYGNTDFDKLAYEMGVHSKHQTEKACAHNCDVFTTVSEITGQEAENLLGRKPDVLLLNGLNMDKFPTFEEISIKHTLFKNRIKEFLMYYFFPYYHFDLGNTLIFFLCGRYEFHDKGIDLFTQALADLNNRLKAEGSKKTVIAFFWVPGNIKGIKQSLLENKKYYDDVKESLDDNTPDIKNKILHRVISQQDITTENIIEPGVLGEIKRKVHKLVRLNDGNPPLVTHDLYNEENDQIVKAFRELGLTNKEEDRVKVVFYSIYLTGADGLLNTSYYESMMGSHLGVFPSYYEPWGYTPLEAGALGVSSVTTDLAGFGKYIQQKHKKQQKGVFVLNRIDKKDDEVEKQLGDFLYKFTNFTKQQRIQQKMAARHMAMHADWKEFANNYYDAHNLAISKVYKGSK